MPINRLKNEEKELLYIWFSAMHTRVDMVFCGVDEAKEDALVDAVYNEVKRLEGIGNRFVADSEISKVNLLAYRSPVIVSDDLYTMIEQGLSYYEETFGAFDITVQSEDNYTEGISNISMNKNDRSIFFKNKCIKLDLSGYVKGYALDKIRPILKKYDCANAFINMGNSSIMAIGNQPAGEGWTVKIDNLALSDKGMTDIILFDECLTTSGNHDADRRHIINPQSRRFVEDVRSQTVKTNNGTLGEVLSTALIAASENQAARIREKYSDCIL